MIRVAAELGVDVMTCLRGTGLPLAIVDDPTTQIEGQQELTVLRNILKQLGPHCPFGLLSGQRYHLTTHGMWGFGVLSSSTHRQALEFSHRYFDLSYSFNRCSFTLEDGQVKLIYDDSDNPDDLKAVLVERDMAALVTLCRDVTGHTVATRSLQLRAARPLYANAFVSLFGIMPQFNAALNSIGGDAALLDKPQPQGDALGARVCEEQCRNLIAQRGAAAGVAGRVRAMILSKPGEIPSMSIIAEQLGTSTRTLRNQLYREHTSYRELVEEIRQKLAEQLLLADQLTVDQIAHRLGYADMSSFTAAFKRWKGVPPRGYKTGHLRHGDQRG